MQIWTTLKYAHAGIGQNFILHFENRIPGLRSLNSLAGLTGSSMVQSLGMVCSHRCRSPRVYQPRDAPTIKKTRCHADSAAIRRFRTSNRLHDSAFTQFDRGDTTRLMAVRAKVQHAIDHRHHDGQREYSGLSFGTHGFASRSAKPHRKTEETNSMKR
jgi:hypothetical protein